MKNDWRLTNQVNYLFRSTLKKVDFKKKLDNDHEHCEFCWAKFGESKDMLSSGYCTIDEYHWICEKCFQDFREQFEWRLKDI